MNNNNTNINSSNQSLIEEIITEVDENILISITIVS